MLTLDGHFAGVRVAMAPQLIFARKRRVALVAFVFVGGAFDVFVAHVAQHRGAIGERLMAVGLLARNLKYALSSNKILTKYMTKFIHP